MIVGAFIVGMLLTPPDVVSQTLLAIPIWLLYELGINSYSKFSVHPNSKEALELCLLRMLTFNPLQKLTEGTINQGSDGAEKKI